MEETVIIQINGRDVKIVCNYPPSVDSEERDRALQKIAEMLEL